MSESEKYHTLCLSRKDGESILLRVAGTEILCTIVASKKGKCRVRILAQQSVRITRASSFEKCEKKIPDEESRATAKSVQPCCTKESPKIGPTNILGEESASIANSAPTPADKKRGGGGNLMPDDCRYCLGAGVIRLAIDSESRCSFCRGTGKLSRNAPDALDPDDCRYCLGVGTFEKLPSGHIPRCLFCRGTGKYSRNSPGGIIDA